MSLLEVVLAVYFGGVTIAYYVLLIEGVRFVRHCDTAEKQAFYDRLERFSENPETGWLILLGLACIWPLLFVLVVGTR